MLCLWKVFLQQSSHRQPKQFFLYNRGTLIEVNIANRSIANTSQFRLLSLININELWRSIDSRKCFAYLINSSINILFVYLWRKNNCAPPHPLLRLCYTETILHHVNVRSLLSTELHIGKPQNKVSLVLVYPPAVTLDR